MSTLLSGVEPVVAAVIQWLINDPLVKSDVVHKRYISEEYDEDLKQPVQVTEDSAFSAASSLHTTSTVRALQAAVEVGSKFYLVEMRDIPNGISMKDTLVENGKNYRITDIHWLLKFGAIVSVAGTKA